ncbi:hypothetical protein INT45_006327, partial [Circinella minor]
FSFISKKVGERALIDALQTIATWRSESSLKGWAMDLMKDQYQSLTTLETEEHWTTVASILANASQHQSYLQYNNNIFKRAIDYQEASSSTSNIPKRFKTGDNNEDSEDIDIPHAYRSPLYVPQQKSSPAHNSQDSDDVDLLPFLLNSPTASNVNSNNLSRPSSPEKQEDDLYKIPSDLTDNKHPARKSSVYNLSYSIEPEAHTDLDMPDDWWSQDAKFNISRACRQFKYSSSLVSIDNPSALSDIRFLSLNNIYLFSEEWEKSIAKYFGWDRHTSITDSLGIDVNKPEVTAQSLLYATKVSMSLNKNWLSVIKSISQFISEATTSEVQLDIHTSIALLKLAPKFIHGGPPDPSVEDTFVHEYIAPLLESVFESEPLFKINWANGTLIAAKQYKPDYVVFVKGANGNSKYEVVSGEFKAPDLNAQLESDDVKLAKQMRMMYNSLVERHVMDPIVSGVLVQGYEMSTYKMDMAGPNMYRLIKLGSCNIFKSLQEFHSIPIILSHVIQLKVQENDTRYCVLLLELEIATITAKKVQAMVVAKNNLEPLKHSPPLTWLNTSTCTLIQKRSRCKTEIK